jgi:hypothetical protein
VLAWIQGFSEHTTSGLFNEEARYRHVDWPDGDKPPGAFAVEAGKAVRPLCAIVQPLFRYLIDMVYIVPNVADSSAFTIIKVPLYIRDTRLRKDYQSYLHSFI